MDTIKRDLMDQMFERFVESYSCMLETADFIEKRELRLVYREITKDMMQEIKSIRKQVKRINKSNIREEKLQKEYIKMGRYERVIKLESMAKGNARGDTFLAKKSK